MLCLHLGVPGPLHPTGVGRYVGGAVMCVSQGEAQLGSLVLTCAPLSSPGVSGSKGQGSWAVFPQLASIVWRRD